jgi:glycosyltransferase involved in cell wall biosynthesis
MRNLTNNSRAHILFIVENNTVPTDIRVWREAKAARQAGYEVSIISPVCEPYSKKNEVIEGIKIYRHPGVNIGKGKIKQILEYVNAFFWEALLSVRIFSSNPFQIIHGANPPDHIFILCVIFKFFNVKYIFDHHDLAPELYRCKYLKKKDFFYYFLKMMEELSCRMADLVISTNESYKRHIIANHGIPPSKIHIVRNDPEARTRLDGFTQPQKIDSASTKLLYVGSINYQDGVDMLVRVVYSIVKEFQFKKIQCQIVGDGDNLQNVRKLCSDLCMDQYISFSGYIHDREKINNLIDEADICVETARDSEVNRKSTFIKIMEYMSAGKPIVAFDLDETRFSVGDTAILVEPDNIQAFAIAVINLVDNPKRIKKFSEQSQKRIINYLNWEIAKKNLLNAYDLLLKVN